MHWIKSIIVVFVFVSGLLLVGTAVAQEQMPEFQGGIQVTLDVNLAADDINVEDLRTTAAIIARRLAALEITDYRVQIVNGQSIQVQLPAVDDLDSILETISQTALLELVDFSGLASKVTQFDGLTIATSWGEDEGRDGEGQANPLTGEAFETVLTGADLKSAQAEVASYDPNQWTIIFELTDDAAAIFGDYTESHIGEPLAIVLDGRVLSIPVIQSRLDSQGVISGNFTKQEAEQLASQLRAGALPLPLIIAQTDTIETIQVDS